jgi:HAE1 family hydrophobic/amphiphilic exporter-1
MRRALGVAVFFGMIGVTTFGLLFTPAFYVISRKFGDWVASKVRRKPKDQTPPDAAPEPIA